MNIDFNEYCWSVIRMALIYSYNAEHLDPHEIHSIVTRIDKEIFLKDGEERF